MVNKSKKWNFIFLFYFVFVMGNDFFFFFFLNIAIFFPSILLLLPTAGVVARETIASTTRMLPQVWQGLRGPISVP